MNRNEIIGVACLIRAGSALVLEVQKEHKWVRRPGSHRVGIGIGCIGGALEPGETPLAALQRECLEEMGLPVQVVPAPETWLTVRGGWPEPVDWHLGGPAPALLWEADGPGFIPGARVAVYLGQAPGAPRPGDLPALLLVTPALLRGLLSGSVATVAALRAQGGEVRGRVGLPDEAELELRGTLGVLRDLLAVRPGLVEALLVGSSSLDGGGVPWRSAPI